jgi:phthiocerol/phenolphthiocerol synthesis type-I polyketide synthase C
MRWRSELGEGRSSPLIADLLDEPAGKPAAGDVNGRETSLTEAVRRASRQERQRLLTSYLRDHVAGKLGLTPSRLDIQLPLNRLGVDSLIAVELRTQIERDLSIVVPVVQLLDGPSVAGLADWLGDRFLDASAAKADPIAAAGTGATPPNGAPGPEAPGAAGSRWMDLLVQLPEVPDNEVDELLRELLARRRSGPERPEEEPANQALAAREGKHDG